MKTLTEMCPNRTYCFGFDRAGMERVENPFIPCDLCLEFFDKDDCGLLMYQIGQLHSGGQAGYWRGYHIECNLRTFYGSADCQSRGPHEPGTCIDVREGQTVREAAKEAVEVHNKIFADKRTEPKPTEEAK